MNRFIRIRWLICFIRDRFHVLYVAERSVYAEIYYVMNVFIVVTNHSVVGKLLFRYHLKWPWPQMTLVYGIWPQMIPDDPKWYIILDSVTKLSSKEQTSWLMSVFTLVKNLLVSLISDPLYILPITTSRYRVRHISNRVGNRKFQHANIVENVSHVVQQWKNMKRVSAELESPLKKIEN